ncbi:4-hydroxybenzoate octaprenyltransferase [Faunimonas sp. B44]|uniref:4-hydroxybenzoate octaprenyltransferase n=1 Tax=Faunimonas sp. B44 TaxID=3461493 RepID=UPI0040445EFD
MTARADSLPDAAPRNWVDRHAPGWLRPYARLARWDRPIGWWLLLWPCWWSAALAAIAAGRSFPVLWHLAFFLVGAIAMRGAGCTYNDFIDRDLDAQVARTRMRPIASGAVSARQAAVFLVLQALVGLAVLLQFNAFTIWLGLASLLVVAFYPFAKRVTDWPQVVLGFAFSWGALMGWAALFGGLGFAPLALYAGAIAWTIGYDTIYALQDREDDAVVGVRSTARLFGGRARLGIALFFALAILLFGLAFVAADAGIFAFGGLAAAAAHFAWQVATLDPRDTASALRRFKANSTTGWILFVGLLLDAALRF